MNLDLTAQQIQILRTEVNAMQKEINDVLNDLQLAMQGMGRATSMALEVFDSRITKLEETPKVPQPDADKSGVEL